MKVMPQAPLRHCQVGRCRNLTRTARCEQHSHRPTRDRGHRPYADPDYKRVAGFIVQRHIDLTGLRCPGASDMNHEPHAVRTRQDLTIDHIDGDNTNHEPSNLRVLCRRMNSRKGNR